MSPTLKSCQTTVSTEQSRRLKTTHTLHSYQYTQLRETPCFRLTFQVDQVEMLLLCLLVPLGLAMADTDPRDFARLCDSEECPANWKKVDAGCILFAGWEEVSAREVCRQNRAEYSEWLMMESDSATRHSLPVCLVRQCQCGRPNRGSKIVGGENVERNEYPWQVRLAISGCGEACCGGSVLTRDKILTAAHCTVRSLFSGNKM